MFLRHSQTFQTIDGLQHLVTVVVEDVAQEHPVFVIVLDYKYLCHTRPIGFTEYMVEERAHLWPDGPISHPATGELNDVMFYFWLP